MRWITAAIFFGLLVWLLWAFGGFTNQRAVPMIFRVYSVLTLLYCLFISTARTSDCISGERREGTLGLLFLTNLNSGEIIVGKLCSSALASVYGLMAIFPMLALPLLMGGITFSNFGRTLLALLNGIFSALAAGFLASVVCRRQFTAISLALGAMVAMSGGLMLGAAAANSFPSIKPLAPWLATFSPLHTLLAADSNTRAIGRSPFWQSAAAVAGASLGCLGLTTSLLARTWRDRPKRRSGRRWRHFCRRSEPSSKRAALRRRLLAINPVFWLAAPKRIDAPVLMLLAVALTSLTVYVAAPYFGRALPGGASGPVLGHLFAWLWAGLILHALGLYYAATVASQPLAEDKQTGALELILSTPTTERTIFHGLWLAYARKMLFPALLSVLLHVFFIWQFLVMATLDPPGQIPPGATPTELFWNALLDTPFRGGHLDWQFGFMLRVVLLILLQVIVSWPTLGWVGRWLGLRMKHSGFAPMASLALLIVPPVLLFSLCCYLADKLHVTRLPERRFLPMMFWLAFGIGIGHCLALSFWAATRLRRNLRSIAMSRYQPLAPWRWRLPSRRALRRFAVVSGCLAAAAASLITSYYGYQNWRGKRVWRNFQAALKQRGEPLNISTLLSRPAPAQANFARSPAFLAFLNSTNRETRDLLRRVSTFDPPSSAGGAIVLMDWSRHTNSSLHPFVNWNAPQPNGRPSTKPNHMEDAAAILRNLESQSNRLHELAVAAARLSIFQISTNRDAKAVLHPAQPPILLLERLHLLFQARACSFLALSRNREAAADVLTGLHLASLASQLPDARSTFRVQHLLGRSLQPLWEGLNQQAWSEPDLAELQGQLAAFNFLADYTNTVRRVVLAHIDIWRQIPIDSTADFSLSELDGSYAREPTSQLQPRAWWYESCVQLHNAGRHAIEVVDLASGRIRPPDNWSDLEGLPLDWASTELLQQSSWWAANPDSLPFVQTSVNQAILACALERFRLLHGTYPETLDQLIPALIDRIPHDAVSGRPLIYEPGGTGRFILRGVGTNGINDRKNKASDDWLWTYSTNLTTATK